MGRRITYKSHDVILTDHAWKRYCERANVRPTPGRKKRLAALLHVKLNSGLAVGLHIDRTGAAWLEIGPQLWASARLTERGWMVMTVIDIDFESVG